MCRQQAIRSFLLALWIGLGQVVWAQLPGSSGNSTLSPTVTPSPESVETRRADLQARLVEVEKSLKDAPSPALAAPLEQSDVAPPYRTSLQRMESNLRRMLSLLESDALLEAQTNRVEADNLEFTQKGLTESRPYPITLLDSLRDQLALAQDDLESQESALKSAQIDSRFAERQLEERQALRRRLLERSQKTGQQDLELERSLENATWAVRALESTKDLAEAETENSRKARALAEKRRDLLKRKVSLVESQFLFTEAIFQRQLGELEARRNELNTALSQARARVDGSLAKVKSLQADPAKADELRAEIEWLTTYQRIKSLREQQLEWNLIQRDLWERRYNLSRGEGVSSLSDWYDASRGVAAQLRNARAILESELKQLNSQTAEALGEPTVTGSHRTLRVQALSTRQVALEDTLRSIDTTMALAQRISAEISERRKHLSWRERVTRGWAWLVDLWNIELYTIGDNSVTVGKINVALLVLVLGLTTTGRVTKFFSRRLLVRLPITDSVRANLERSLRYFFFLLVFLFALQVVNIPLTIFTFLGGTLAIAVGFGAQNILNNFISGLILMVEQPVRVGDLIEVEQTTGVVEEIGARSTRVRMGTGIHVVLPNSVLLENRVINWTLTDQRVRTSVSVGVAYGVDPQEVIDLIKRAALMTEKVEKSPEPFVLLEDFADSALTFTIHFWVSLAQPLNKRMAESELRIAIERLFRSQEIPIPFPQRDLNFSGPIPVTVLNPEDEGASED